MRWNVKFLSWISKDFYALKPHGDFVTRIHETFINSLALDENIVQQGKTVIPTWAVLSASDFWVDKLSASIQLPANRLRVVRGSHTAIVKPRNQQADAYHFIRECVRACLARGAASSERLSISSRGSVSKVEMAAPRALIYMALFPSISTFETPPFEDI
jgi:hypothetical protein